VEITTPATRKLSGFSPEKQELIRRFVCFVLNTTDLAGQRIASGHDEFYQEFGLGAEFDNFIFLHSFGGGDRIEVQYKENPEDPESKPSRVLQVCYQDLLEDWEVIILGGSWQEALNKAMEMKKEILEKIWQEKKRFKFAR